MVEIEEDKVRRSGKEAGKTRSEVEQGVVRC